MELYGLDWSRLGRDKWRVLVNVIKNLRVPSSARKLSSSYTSLWLSSIGQLHSVSYISNKNEHVFLKIRD
jgi:hypothetical protein